MKILEDKGYVYKKHLSTGGEGEVHLIRSMDKDFIAKIFPTLSDDSIDILKSIMELNISSIPKIHDIFNYENKTIVIRDFVCGTTLYDEIKKNEYLSFKRAKTIILKICETLKRLHNAKPNPIIYRDLKPENIIVTPEGNIHLIDFGIARYYKMESTRDTVIAGTKGYTAPEVMAGMQSDMRSDVYSAGLLFYEMLTGKNLLELPFQIRPVKESNEYLPEWLDSVIEKATDLNQTNRYKTIEEFINAIENPIIKKKEKRIFKNNIRKNLISTLALILVIVSALLIINAIPNKEGFTEVMNSSLPEEGLYEKYNILIDLEFDDEKDKKWITSHEESDRIGFFNEQLHVLKEGCNIDYIAKPGMIIHYKVKQPEYGAVGVSGYRINSEVSFEGIYHNDEENKDYNTNMIYFDGFPFKNYGQFVDAIIYVTEDNSAVYAIAIDEEANKICYTSYKVPEELKNIPMYLEIYNFTNGDDSVIVERVRVANGSLRKYLEDNFESYTEHREMVDDFLEKDAASLNEMPFKPVD